MLDALKRSSEPLHLRELAMKYLRGVKGSLAQQKRLARDKMQTECRDAVHGTGLRRLDDQTGDHDTSAPVPRASTGGEATSREFAGVANGPNTMHISAAQPQREDIEDRLRAAFASES